jgi:hypothetical protein
VGQSFVEMKKQVASSKRETESLSNQFNEHDKEEERRGAKRYQKEQSRIDECNNEVRATGTHKGLDGNFLNVSIDATNNGIMLYIGV